METRSFQEVLREWRYVYDHYGGEFPLTVLVYNCNSRQSGTLLKIEIGEDARGQCVELTLIPDGSKEETTLTINEDSVWWIKGGISSKGRRLLTKDIE